MSLFDNKPQVFVWPRELISTNFSRYPVLTNVYITKVMHHEPTGTEQGEVHPQLSEACITRNATSIKSDKRWAYHCPSVFFDHFALESSNCIVKLLLSHAPSGVLYSESNIHHLGIPLKYQVTHVLDNSMIHFMVCFHEAHWGLMSIQSLYASYEEYRFI